MQGWGDGDEPGEHHADYCHWYNRWAVGVGYLCSNWAHHPDQEEEGSSTTRNEKPSPVQMIVINKINSRA